MREEQGEATAIANSRNHIARAYQKQRKLPQALEILSQNLSLDEQEIGKKELAATTINLAVIYRRQENLQHALTLSTRGLSILRALGDKEPVCKVLSIVGDILNKMRNYSKAIEYYTESLALAEELHLKQEIATSLSGLGFSYQGLKEYPKSTEYLKRSLAIREELGLRRGLSFLLSNIGMGYLVQNQYSQAIIWCKKGLRLAEEISLVDSKYYACECLYSAEKALNHNHEALAYLERLILLKDSLGEEETSIKLQELEFSQKVLKDSLAFVQEKAETEHAYLLERDRRNYLLISLLFATMIFFFFLYRQWSINRQSAVEIQQERERKEQLAELNSLQSRFFTNISHEFRTPLTVITGMTEQLVEDSQYEQEGSKGFSRKFREGSRLILRNTNNLLHLINQMLDLAKLDRGRLKVHMELGDVIAFLRYLAESFASYAHTQNIQLAFSSDVQSLDMDYDRQKLLHIISNLLSNALKFTPEGGLIDFHVSQIREDTDHKLRISIFNSGIGIPEEQQNNIFDRFYQIDDTGHPGGTGIGLAMTKELVQLLEGSISVSSEPGKGAAFTVLLPIRQTAEPRQEKPHKERLVPFDGEEPIELLTTVPPTEAPLLLLVEDNADVATYIRGCLQGQYSVLWVENGQKGIEKALETIPDLIISDVMMPEKDGYELTQWLKNDERTSHIPIILLTAKAGNTDKIAGLEKGADAYLYKPFNKKELLVRVEQLIALRQRLQAHYSQNSPLATLPAPNSTTPKSLPLEDAFLKKVNGILEIHHSDSDFEIPRLSRELAMSHSQLYRKIKALTGKSIAAYLRRYRLFKSRDLLQDSSLTVSEVAYRVGFADPSYFSRMYLEEFGERPTEGRKS